MLISDKEEKHSVLPTILNFPVRRGKGLYHTHFICHVWIAYRLPRGVVDSVNPEIASSELKMSGLRLK